MRFGALTTLVFVAVACSRPSETETAWREMLSHSSECPAAPVAPAPSWVGWPLAFPQGEFHLPRSFRPAGAGTSPMVWLGPDSSEVHYAVLPEPSSAMAGRSPLLSRLRRPSYRLERGCRLGVGGHEGLIDTFQHVDSAKTDTVFGLAASVVIRSNHFAEVLALTPTTAMRDSLFSAVTALQWR
jgi:hypothetical protein